MVMRAAAAARIHYIGPLPKNTINTDFQEYVSTINGPDNSTSQLRPTSRNGCRSDAVKAGKTEEMVEDR